MLVSIYSGKMGQILITVLSGGFPEKSIGTASRHRLPFIHHPPVTIHAGIRFY